MQTRRSAILQFCVPAVAAFAVSALPGQARALEPLKNEEASLKACEEAVCNIILKKDASGKNPTCSITKTWARDTIKKGETKSVSWMFGDTRCQANLEVSREDIVNALTRDKYTMRSKTQTVKCIVEQDGQQHPVTAKAAPKLKFKGGQADKIWINLENIQGPDNVTGTISTIAAMENKFGIFHGSLIKSVNKFIHKRCAQKYGPDAKKTAEAEAVAPAQAKTSP